MADSTKQSWSDIDGYTEKDGLPANSSLVHIYNFFPVRTGVKPTEGPTAEDFTNIFDVCLTSRDEVDLFGTSALVQLVFLLPDIVPLQKKSSCLQLQELLLLAADLDVNFKLIELQDIANEILLPVEGADDRWPK